MTHRPTLFNPSPLTRHRELERPLVHVASPAKTNVHGG